MDILVQLRRERSAGRIWEIVQDSKLLNMNQTSLIN